MADNCLTPPALIKVEASCVVGWRFVIHLGEQCLFGVCTSSGNSHVALDRYSTRRARVCFDGSCTFSVEVRVVMRNTPTTTANRINWWVT